MRHANVCCALVCLTAAAHAQCPDWADNFAPGADGVNNLVLSMATFDDGGGPALYAGGFFSNAGSSGASRIARWDGASWSVVDPTSSFMNLGSVANLGVYQ